MSEPKPMPMPKPLPVFPESGEPSLSLPYPSADAIANALGFPDRPGTRRPPLTAERIA